MTGLNDEEYRELLRLRGELRRFLGRSESRARSVGLTPAQHQLLVAIRGLSRPYDPTVGEVAEHLLLRHNSAVQLVDRASSAGLVRRRRDDQDARIVRLQLTEAGRDALATLGASDLEELTFLSNSLPPPDRSLSRGG